ncbi:MAG: transketolase [Mycobacteriales bacterium]
MTDHPAATTLLDAAPDDLDARAINIARALAMDAVQKAGNGHPGTAMSLAPLAHVIFQEFRRHDPADPTWPGRDPFVLSCGHASLLQYVQLFLTGYGLTLDDLRAFRQFGSRTPGHPEYGHTPGVDVTTGPLGQGFANGVGMAMADRRFRGLFDPDAAPGASVFDRTVWVICSDGDLEEGVSSEAASLAGHQRLGHLVYVYDDNHISIDGDTAKAFSEDVVARFDAYGWHTQRLWDAEGVGGIRKALTAARAELERPSLIALRSHIGFPAPTKRDSAAAHGSALGEDEVRATKEILGLDPDAHFAVPDDVLAHCRRAVDRGRELHAEWDTRLATWAESNDELARERERIIARRLPPGLFEKLPSFNPGEQVATRSASGKVLAAIGPLMPELFGGSADLAESNNTSIEGEESFLPDSPYGRTLHWGVREHAMGSTMNGMALTGEVRPYGGTFLVFSDYMRPAVRLAALMKLPVTYVWTHDSIGLGEDGPTHQPIEHLAALRATPGLAVVRPADATETAVAWQAVLERADGPAALCLTRQKLPVLDRAELAAADGVARGGYVLADAATLPQVILIGTGSEVALCLEARALLEAEGYPTRVVSMPCREWFAEQDAAYRDAVLPPAVAVRVSVEAAVAQGWRDLVGDHGECVSVEHFGASAPYEVLYEQFGLTPERIVAAATRSLSRVGATVGTTTGS